ncbi:hypothetical protein BOV89_10680 [Solemya velum gill symbiont]|uniref:hypothetical protein n=1 Tax=Solemya velum gill symbiont TaxID=2340 RepID=UPI000996D1E8|nr:hypothetical protein [Solemya velum gill symbiont]OOY36786.1 hypothetical protein BOV89_10680 [Solemya velum gill symbiont]
MEKGLLSGFLIGTALTLIIVSLCLAYIADTAFLAGIQVVGSIAVGFSAIIAYRLYRSNADRHQQDDDRKRSETFLNESIELLERAYETFTRSGHSPPDNDRLLWLSTARMLLRFNKMKSLITESDHIHIADENEEYMRLKFYTLLDSCRDRFTLDYFMPNRRLFDGDNIDRKSLAVIFDFSKWKEGTDDPLDAVDDQELFAQGAAQIDYLGVHSYIEQDQRYWEEIKRRKTKYDEQQR